MKRKRAEELNSAGPSTARTYDLTLEFTFSQQASESRTG